LYTLLKPPLRAAVVVCLGLLFIGATVGGATAATLAGDDAYHLPAGQVIEDNLYVMAGEIIIDGTLDGDLVAMGSYIEVNGEIRGDVLAMGGGIVINGAVTGDVRIVGGGLAINGVVGGDLVSAGGGAAPEMLAFPLELNGRRIEQGTRLAASASIGKDALMTGGIGVIQGAIAGTLWAAMGAIQLDGTVGGDANLYGSQITVSEHAPGWRHAALLKRRGCGAGHPGRRGGRGRADRGGASGCDAAAHVGGSGCSSGRSVWRGRCSGCWYWAGA
jgi:cytoskeletal protein CcmA (bactofilin family)